MIESLTLILTDKCNSYCKYCYQKFLKKENNLELNNFWHENDLENLKKIITNIQILHFFGGEPLIEENFIFKLDNYLDQLKIKKPIYIFSTNLVHISERFKNFLIKLKRENHQVKFIISIDGPREIHNANRILKNKQSSFDNIKKNYLYISSLGFSIDSVVAVYNQEHLKKNISILDTIKFLSIEFPKIQNIQISCEYYIKGIRIEEQLFQELYLKSIENIFYLILSKNNEAIYYGKFIKKLIEELIYYLLKEERKNYLCLNQINRITIFPDKKIFTCPEEYYFNYSHKAVLGDEFNYINFSEKKDTSSNLKFNYKEIKCKNCEYIKVCHICPLDKETLEKQCQYKKLYFNILFNNLEKIFNDIEIFNYFKKITEINAQNLKTIFLYMKSNLK